MKTLAIEEYNLNQLEKLKEKLYMLSHNDVISWLLVKARVMDIMIEEEKEAKANE